MIKLPSTQILLACLLSFTLQAQNYITPLDVAKLKSISWFDVSTNGQYALYGLVNPADPLVENETATIHLHVIDLDDQQGRELVTDRHVISAAFRPQAETVTFLARNNEKSRVTLWEVDIAGGVVRELFSFARSIKKFKWSADGKSLAFTAADEQLKSEAPYQPEIFEENLIYTRAFVVNLPDQNPQQVNIEGTVYELEWSPDGSKLAVANSPTPLVDDFYVKQQVSIVDSQSLEEVGVIDHKGKLGEFSWSPDGSQLVMIAGANINDPVDGRLFIVPATGGKPQQMMEGFAGMFHQAQWVEKNNIKVLASTGTGSRLLSINPSNGKSKILEESSNGSPVWDAFVTTGEITIFEAASPDHPSELFLRKGQQATRLTDSNPWLAAKVLGEQRVVRYTARDGMEIEGILILPPGQVDMTNLPLITVVHGGPEAHYDNGWLTSYSMPGQVAAASGFAVFYPNYRGSTGRGIEYTMSSQGDQGGKEFDDVVDGVDFLIEQGLVDGQRVGVTGGSYGGYATAWLTTRYSEKFAAGVMFVGISNHISKWGTSDIPEEMYNVHARSRIWDDYEYWLKRSPIYYADQAKTPLLIMHGKEDPRVHPGQSMELYRHIKTRTDTPVRLVLYPGEGHGNRKSTARLDYNLRMLRWFDHYLLDVDTDLNAGVELGEKD